MKKIVSLLLIVLVIVFACGCGGVKIEDENGADNFELATITKDNIIKMDLGASSYGENTSGSSSYTKFSGDDFSGVAEIYNESYSKSDIIIDLIDYEIKGGNFKLVAVCDDEIIHEFVPTDKADVVTLEDVSGNLSLRIAGESAEFTFMIDVW